MTPIAGLVFGVLGLVTVFVEPTVGTSCGLIGSGCSWLALRTRRSSAAYLAVGLNLLVLAIVLAVVVFGSGTKSGGGSSPYRLTGRPTAAATASSS